MRPFKKILLALAIFFIAIQFVQPAHNKSGQVLPTNFATLYIVPSNMQTILTNACYDCHSNNTVYPWYANIQPMAFIMANHVSNGKKELNFSDFGSYSQRRQISKLKSITSQINDGEMPSSSYKLMHGKAKLSHSDKAMLIGWFSSLADSLSANN